ncbi:MAG: hypothetical protein AB7O26_12205 [Planctomycetaceae bacterium]
MRTFRRREMLTIFAASIAAASGCALFEEGSGMLTRTTAKLSERNLLPPIATPRDAMKIDIVLVERPLGDRLVGPTLWQEIDQVGVLPAETREQLREVGIRVGNAGSSPSPTLERLLDIKSSPIDASSEDSKNLVGRYRVLLPGAEDLITTNHFEKCILEIPGRKGPMEREYENANGVFRVRVHKVQDGWARLDFEPEIHFGQSIMRPKFTKTGTSSMFSQEVEPFLDRSFSVNLHVGEMVVITADGDNPRSLGSRCFYAGNDDDRVMQRVLVVRLANMSKTDAMYAK